jgi:hypothetical protein
MSRGIIGKASDHGLLFFALTTHDADLAGTDSEAREPFDNYLRTIGHVDS